VIATSKATELFIGELAAKAHQIAVANNRKTLKLEDIMAAARMNPRQMEFLDECFSIKK
jgi:histone H3/H4